MVQGLSKFYRLTLNDGHVYISLENELEQVRMYLEIQRVKYADAFEVYYDVDPEILQVPIIKLILQPFVENIFKHAWFGRLLRFVLLESGWVTASNSRSLITGSACGRRHFKTCDQAHINQAATV